MFNEDTLSPAAFAVLLVEQCRACTPPLFNASWHHPHSRTNVRLHKKSRGVVVLATGRLASSWSGQHDAAAVSPSLLSWTHRTGGVLVATTSAPRYMFSVFPSSRLVCLSLCHLPTYLSGARAGILLLLLLLCTAGEYYFDATLQPVGYVGDGGGSNGCAVHCREAWQRGGTGAMRAGLITMSCNVTWKGLDVFLLLSLQNAVRRVSASTTIPHSSFAHAR